MSAGILLPNKFFLSQLEVKINFKRQCLKWQDIYENKTESDYHYLHVKSMMNLDGTAKRFPLSTKHVKCTYMTEIVVAGATGEYPETEHSGINIIPMDPTELIFKMSAARNF